MNESASTSPFFYSHPFHSIHFISTFPFVCPRSEENQQPKTSSQKSKSKSKSCFLSSCFSFRFSLGITTVCCVLNSIMVLTLIYIYVIYIHFEGFPKTPSPKIYRPLEVNHRSDRITSSARPEASTAPSHQPSSKPESSSAQYSHFHSHSQLRSHPTLLSPPLPRPSNPLQY